MEGGVGVGGMCGWVVWAGGVMLGGMWGDMM